MLTALGKLWMTGVPVDWEGFHQHQKRRRVPLPTYPFERKRFWAEPAVRAAAQPVIALIQKNGTADDSEIFRQTESIFTEKQNTVVTPATRKERILATLAKQFEELSGKTELSRASTFLEMGFDSLFLVQASQVFHKIFGLKVTFRQLLEQFNTLEELAAHFDRQLPPEGLPTDDAAQEAKADAKPDEATSTPAAEFLTLPLNEAQTEVWLATRWGQDATRAFNQVVSLCLRGTLQIEPLREALNRLVARHDALRTTFLPDGSGQRIAPSGKLDLAVDDLSALKPEERKFRLSEIVRAEDAICFDLVNGPLTRARLVKLSDTEHVLLLTSHHLVLDGWSIAVVLRELGQIYSGLLRGETVALKPAAQLRDYLRWQNAPETRDAATQAQAYWLQQFANPPAPIELPGDRPRPATPSYHAAFASLQLKESLHQSLKESAAQHGVTVFTYLLASLNVWLSRLSGQEDLALGVPAAGQLALRSEEGKSLVGHCVNLLPVRSQCHGKLSFGDYLKTVKHLMLDAYEHQQFTYGNLVRHLNLPRDMSRAPLLSVTFNVVRVLTDIHLTGLEANFSLAPKGFNLFDLSVDVVESETELRLDCRFNQDLFDAATFQRWLGHWETLLEAAVERPECSIATLPMLSEAERHKIVVEWNNTQANFPPDQSLVQLFENRARENPDAIALVFKE